MFIDPLGLWGVVASGSLMGIDIYRAVYDSNLGWWPGSGPGIDVSTTAIGGGLRITFDTPIESSSLPGSDTNVSLGMSKYLGITYNTELSRGSVNLGLGLGLPVSFSTSTQNFAEGLSDKLNTLFGGKTSGKTEGCK